jgi:cell division protein FtsW
MLPFLGILATILVLILVEPDLGTTAVMGATALVIFFLSGEGYLHNIGFSLLLVVSLFVGILAALLESYRLSRVKTFIEVVKTGLPPDKSNTGYQLSQILIAIGSGGFLGVGFGQSKQKFNYLGETAFSDNIYAVIAEEFGFLGAIFIATVFLFIAFRGMKIAQKCTDKQSALLAAGITIWFATQAFFHIAANVGLVPLTGITLPFVSYGGSSMIVTLSAAGLLLNISKYVKLD